jgi:Protein of Unknown function (DUF2784)
MKWRILADLVVTVHAAYVGFVVFGLVAILAGYAMQWQWVRDPYFRLAHLTAILFVCAEALGGWVCPLTTLEDAMRQRAGQAAYAGDFIGYWLDWLIFYNAPQWVFTTLYTAFGALVLATLWLVPPRLKQRHG